MCSYSIIKAGKNAKLPWNMVKNCIKNVNFLQIFRNIGKKKTKISILMINFPQNCKYFPPKEKFPGNEMTKFHFPHV